MNDQKVIEALKSRFDSFGQDLDERQRRLWAAAEAKAIGRGGIGVVSEVAKITPPTIRRGQKELEDAEARRKKDKEENGKEKKKPYRIREVGAGRKYIIACNKDLEQALRGMISDQPPGNLKSLVEWPGPNAGDLSQKLKAQGYEMSAKSIARFLRREGYMLRRGRKKRQPT